MADHHAGTATTGLLHLRTWLPAELDEPFATWCDVHHLEQLALPGFRRVRRFSLVATAQTDPARYLTVYDLDDLSVLESEAYAAHRARGSALPELFKGSLRAARCDAELVDAVGPSTEGPDDVEATAVLHLFVPAGGADLAGWFRDHGARIAADTGADAARLFRSAGGEQVVLVELPSLPPVLDAAHIEALPRPDAGELAWSLFQLDFAATPDS